MYQIEAHAERQVASAKKAEATARPAALDATIHPVVHQDGDECGCVRLDDGECGCISDRLARGR